MQRYFQDRNADPEWQSVEVSRRSTIAEEEIEDIVTRASMVRRANGIKKEIIRTSDIFGKNLKEFRQRADVSNAAPLIFWLLAGYFRSKPEKFNTVGLFRVTSQNETLRELELHLSQENFQYLNTIQDAHIVTNYFKRMLREMKNPLIPFRHYKEYG